MARDSAIDDEERLAVEVADANGWRLIFPLTRERLTVVDARARIRANRGPGPEASADASEAEALIAMCAATAASDTHA